MEYITIGKGKTQYPIREISQHQKNVLRISFDKAVPAKYGDINLYTSSGVLYVTKPDYCTIWRDEGQTMYLSDDSSIYTRKFDSLTS